MKPSLSGTLAVPFALLVLAIAACSGHGSSIVPHASASSASGSHTAKPEYGVTIKLVIPRKPATSGHRKRQYVSYQTESAEVLVNGTTAVAFAVATTAPTCTFTEDGGTCTATVDAPAGSDTFTMETFDGPLDSNGNPTGNLLSTGTAPQTITSTTANQVNLTLDGVVDFIAVSAEPESAPVGTPTTVPVYVTAYDSDGNAIVGPGSYVDSSGNPVSISLYDYDSSGTTSISGGPVTMPDAQSVPSLSYTGAEPHGAVPEIVASATNYGASMNFPLTPVLQVVIPSLQATPSAMTVGNDGNIYLLEPAPGVSDSDIHPTVEQYVPGNSADSTFSYTGCNGDGVLAVNPGIVSVGSNLYFAVQDTCDGSGAAQVIGMTTSGAFSNNTINLTGGSVTGSTALGYSGSGSNVQLVAAVTPTPSASPFSPPGSPSFVTTDISGTPASSYLFASTLTGLSATDNYTFTDVPGFNVITYDPNGNAWFPETITDNTANTSSNVIVRAGSSTAVDYPVPAATNGSGPEQIVAVTTGSDGKIWYVGNRVAGSNQTIVAGNVSNGGTFHEYPLASNSSPIPVSNAIIEGSDAALYTVVTNNIVRITHAGTITATSSTNTLNAAVSTAVRTSAGEIYFTGRNEAQGDEGVFTSAGLYQLLY